MRIYFDVCCYNRPFDDCLNDRIEIEADAVLSILFRCKEKNWTIIGSEVIDNEISKMADAQKRLRVEALSSIRNITMELNDTIVKRALELEVAGLKAYDSLHLASAEYADVDIFITTDKKLVNGARKVNLSIEVYNPVNWLMEVTENESEY